MTILGYYVLFGLPLIAVGIALGALWLTKRDYEQDVSREKAAAETKSGI